MAGKTKDKSKKIKVNKTKSILARQDDGTVQVTMTVPYSLVKDKREEALNHLIQDLEVPGFRKGKTPKDVALKHIDQQRLYNHTLQHLLPDSYASVVEEHKLRPILAPRFEILKIEEGDDWVIRAITCELPEVSLGNYKKTVSGLVGAGAIWTPGQAGQTDDRKPPTREEKEQKILRVLLDEVNVKIPKLLVDEEVNHRLSGLLEQVQKLGLTVEQYLASTGKTVDQIKLEYGKTAEEAIKLEIILNKIAEEEKISVEDEEIEEVIEKSGNEQTRKALSTPEQHRLIRSVLRRRKALDSLVKLM